MGTGATRTGRRLTAVLAGAVLCAALLAGCERGEVSGTSQVTDVSAMLHGTVHSSDPTPEYWFEYDDAPQLVDGVLVFDSSSAHNEWACCGPMLTGSLPISGLTPSTTYHYRFCIRNDSGGGLCGAPGSFTTKPDDRDVVEGTLGRAIIPELGYGVQASVSVRAEPDGSDPVGTASKLPGSAYFRLADSGPVTCVRIVGSRAAVGFSVPDPTGSGQPDTYQMLVFEDHGTTGDLYVGAAVAERPDTCPDPTTWSFAGADTQVTGNITIVDHPG